MRTRTRALLCVIAAIVAIDTFTARAYTTFGKWAVSQVVIYINPQNSDVTASAAESALLTGMNAWNNEGRANFSFLYAGRVNDTAVGFDNRNVVLFRNEAQGSTIAATYSWSSGTKIVDADMVFFDGGFTFVTGTGPCSVAAFIEDIAAHEFGHVLGLGHSTDPSATMLSGYPYCSQDFRTLAADDIAGIQSLYGAAPGPVNTKPTVTITSPASGLSLTSGNAMAFSGSASDSQDGDLSSRLNWTSSLDGAIGSGASFTRTLSAGVHVVTASVADNGGMAGSASVTVTITAPTVPLTPTSTGGTNVALASAGAVASASSTYSGGFSPAAAINGDRAGRNWGSGAAWTDGTSGSFPDWLQVDFAGSYSIGQVNVFSVQDNYPSPSEPTATQTCYWYCTQAFEVQYWTGSGWATIPGASVSGNNLVWRTVTFTPVTTQKIRVMVNGSADGYSRLTEVEAYTTDSAPPPPPPPPPGGGTNVALASAGAVASASSAYSSGFAPSSVINGDRAGRNWGNGAAWTDSTSGSFPDWLQVDFAGSYSIGQVNVFSVQDNYPSPSEPTTTQTCYWYCTKAFEVQYWTGAGWVMIPGASVTSNNLVWRTVTFTPVTTQKIRVVVNGSADGYSRLTEVEAYTTDSTPGPPPPPPPSGGINVARASAGAVASASSAYSPGFSPAGVIDGERSGLNWANGGGWNDATWGSFPDWLEVDFAASYSISQVNVFTVQDNFLSPVAPTASHTFTLYGVRAFDVQYWTGAGWATIPGATVTGNNLIWRTVTFTPVTTQKIRVVVNESADGFSRLTEVEAYTSDSTSGPANYTYQVVRQYPHDTGAFTQGLELYNNFIYESTGLNGSSTLRQVDLQTGTVLRRVDVPSQYFAEGMTIFQGKVFQLTWQSQVGFVYDLSTFAKTGQFSYAGEGWGLTHDSQYLIMSDGTSQIRFLDPATFQTVRSITVLDGQSPVTRINELEYVNGQIYANIWQTDRIARIDPASGQVTGWIDLQGLLPAGTSADVLNGIAFDQASGHFLVTGKFWPTVFEITLQQIN